MNPTKLTAEECGQIHGLLKPSGASVILAAGHPQLDMVRRAEKSNGDVIRTTATVLLLYALWIMLLPGAWTSRHTIPNQDTEVLSLGTAGESISTANIDFIQPFRRLYSRNVPKVTVDRYEPLYTCPTTALLL